VFSTKVMVKVRVGKHLSDAYPIRNFLEQGLALLPLLFNLTLECTIRKVKVKLSL
jgi:hypothetical protein